jgi:uncharacterized membrane protein YdbT with pleckstrin-like domain
VAFAAAPSMFVAAACFFFWALLSDVLLDFAIVLPIICAAVPALVLIERIARYRKTAYEVRSDRILVRTGTLFTGRAIELELENITLVEWKSPYLLRLFYGAGHLTAQEAGSATQSARLAYIEQPEALYDRIAEYMRERGFSMQRRQRIRQESPGPVGAVLDLLGRLAALIYTVGLLGLSEGADLWLFFADDAGPSVLQLVLGNYDVFQESAWAIDVLSRMRIGVLVLGIISLLATGVYLTLAFIDLLRRTYTLHDDVIDYEDGFLSQTRRFIPLENLADTKLTRPIHKRLLGFGDLRVSSRGAGSEILFRSLPRGKKFASALERLIEKTDAPRDSGAGPRVYEVDENGTSTSSASRPNSDSPPVGQTSPIDQKPPVDIHTFKPWVTRGVASAVVRLLPATLVVLAAPVIAVLSGETFEFGPFAIGGVGALSLAGLAILGAIGAVSITKSVIVTMATEYRFDHRRVGESFDFISSRQTKFSVDKITSMSVLRNPFDRLMDTMTVRVRSIGTRETIDFKNIRYDDELLDALRRTLGLGRQGIRGPDRRQSSRVDIDPDFSVLEELKAKVGAFAFVPLLWALGVWLATLVHGSVWPAWAMFGCTLLVAMPYLWWRGVYHSRLEASLFEDHLEVSGGVFRRFRHMACFRHIKAVESVRYPASSQGDLNLATGGGFSIGISHLADIGQVHDRIDERLLDHPPGRQAAGRKRAGAHNDTDILRHIPFAPHPPTELVRHLKYVVTALTLPVTGVWVYLLYRGADYRLESTRTFAEIGLIYRRRTTVLFDRVDHLETSRNVAHSLFGTCNVEIYTVGSTSRELVLRSMEDADIALERIRERMAVDESGDAAFTINPV